MRSTAMSNVACRIFAEQIKLLLSLPDQEEAKEVLYQALIKSYNQFENQFEFQNDNQNDNQNYLYLNHISVLSNNIFKILLKSIKWKEFSDNLGGKRDRAGRPKKNPDQPVSASASNQPTPLPKDCSTYADEKPSKRVSYRWEGEVIKLNDKDFTTWLNKYSKINVRRVLEDRDDWLATQPDRIQKNWYMSTVKWLEKLNNEAV